MIIVKIVGGLASQMHKYSIGRALSLKHNVELKLDLSWFANNNIDTKWEYQLEKIFNIKTNEASQKDIKSIYNPNFFINRVTNKIIKKSFFYNNNMNKSFISIEDFNKLPSNIYVYGEFVGFKYFENFEKEIKKDFYFHFKINQKITDELKLIQNCNSVFLHIRRGDYISNSNAAKFHEILDIKYYKKAISKIQEEVDNPYFFVFSDDILWAKENIEFDNVIFIDGNENFEDLMLMSNCKHSIIGNSSFSLTASWLNNNKNKIVISPTKWIKDKSINEKILFFLRKERFLNFI